MVLQKFVTVLHKNKVIQVTFDQCMINRTKQPGGLLSISDDAVVDCVPQTVS